MDSRKNEDGPVRNLLRERWKLSSSLDARKLICDLHEQDAGPSIGKLPGLWKRVIDSRWTIWVNGHMEPLPGGDSGDLLIPPGDCYVEYNGWPAGSFSMITGEGVLAAGSLANYDSFCKALQKAVQEPHLAR